MKIRRLNHNLEAAQKLSRLGLLCVMVMSFNFVVKAQTNESGVFIDPNEGEQDSRVDFNVTGNQVESIITNWGTVGNGNGSINQAGVWPKGTGHGHLHEMTGMILTRTEDVDGQEVTVISDGYGASSDVSDIDPNTNIRWKFQPLPGYFNQNTDEPEIANSRNPDSWPQSWPDQSAEWDGNWNGYFGLNQFNADQEVFYVMDDLSNTEYEYYPVDGDTTKGGLGLQVRVRVFQWSQALAKDILFMQYEVSNIGDQTYTTDINDKPIIFGGYTDVNPAGAGTSDDAAGFDNNQDIVYGWSSTGQGSWTQFRDIAPGYIGWKFLESPGLDFDLTDNDNDGLVDESRDNDAGSFAFAPCGNYDDPQEHWSGDEDCDWNASIDDVGSDGIGPEQDGYPGPDADGSEGNGRPDQGEPNFGRLDNDESDQIGLTSFYAPLFGAVNIHDEETVWPNVQPGFFDVPSQGVNQIWIFGSGAFQLPPNTSQRFSTSFVFGANEDAMFRSAAVAQRIYDSDYRFAVPPRQPRLRAIPGDGKVTLIWDELSEVSRDPVYGEDFEGYRIIKSTDPQFNDAEDVTDSFGNSVYKRSIAQFDKINGLTGYHELQFGEEIGIPNGVHYYMGEDTGIQHSFVDEDVINGRTYYYALIAYDAGYDETYFDRGISDLDNLFPISPSESPASITVTQGVVTNYDPNTVEVRPNPEASNVVLGTLDVDNRGRVDQDAGKATGTVRASVVDENLLKDQEYSLSFSQKPVVYPQNDTSAVEYETTAFSITDKNGNLIVDNSPVPTNLDGEFVTNWTYELLEEGLILQFENQYPNESNTQQNSGWTTDSETNLRTQVTLPDPTFSVPNPPVWPIRAVLEVGGDGEVLDSAYTSDSGNFSFPVNFRLYEKNTGNEIKFIFDEPDSTENGRIDQDELIQLLFKEEPGDDDYVIAWNIKFLKPVDATGAELPANQIYVPGMGDSFELNAQIPFSQQDRYGLTTTASFIDSTSDSSILDEIIVVPNPYVAATIVEERPFLSGRGEQRIEFRNVPLNASIRIFTNSGVFVREIQAEDGVGVWDLQSKDGLEVAYGLYFYHVKAPGIGEKTGKFAIIK